MTTQRIDIPVDLFAQLEAKARAEGKTVDEFASEALRDGLREQKWERLIDRGLENGRSPASVRIRSWTWFSTAETNQTNSTGGRCVRSPWTAMCM
jgi:hypothetical protein